MPTIVCCDANSAAYNSLQGGRGDLQSSAQRSSLQESQEARIDHPCVPAPKQLELELLISVPVQCFAVFPFTQFLNLLIRPFRLFRPFRPFRPQFGLRGALPLERASSLKTSPVRVCACAPLCQSDDES